MTKRSTLLIVDDQDGIRMLLSEVFRHDFTETYLAENGEQALTIVEQRQPDLVLLDIKIPGMDGLEILKQIKQVDVGIKVIMMTAYAELDILEEAFDYGALTYVSKPFDIDDLRDEVMRHMNDYPEAVPS